MTHAASSMRRSKRPERSHARRLHVENLVHLRNARKHQDDERHRADDQIGHEAALPIELLGILYRAIGLKAELHIVGEQAGGERREQNQLWVITDDEDARKERAGG